MSTYYYGGNHQQHHTQNQIPITQLNPHQITRRRPFRYRNTLRTSGGSKAVKELTVSEPANLTAYRARFEAGRSFDLDDDMEFCPYLLTFDERQSVTSGSSDRSSLSSGSPESSPLQQQIQPQQQNPSTLSLPSGFKDTRPPIDIYYEPLLKLHQPSAIRSRDKAIPIVNPSTGIRIASPPTSISPGMMQQTTATRRW